MHLQIRIDSGTWRAWEEYVDYDNHNYHLWANIYYPMVMDNDINNDYGICGL